MPFHSLHKRFLVFCNLIYLFLLFLKKIIIVDLQCCQFLLYNKVIQLYIYRFFLSFFHIILHHVPSQVTDIVPWTIEQNLIAVHSKCNSWHLLTPHSQSLPLPLSPSWQPQVCSPCPCVCFFSVDHSFVPYIKF